MNDAAKPRAGLTVGGRYRLGRHLGDGRMGQVFAATDRETGEKVALKLLHLPLCKVDEQVRRFEREFRLTSQIDHPNSVRMLAFGQETEGPLAGRHYLVMEYVEGRSLEEALEGGRPLEHDRAVTIGLHVARALAAAHDRGVVHRDVKPGNIHLVRRSDGEAAKVLDFGLARLEGQEDDGLTDYGVRLGTVTYMAPEYIARHELDHRSDLYALGVVLYEMLVGQPPFVGRSMRVMQDHVSSKVAHPSRAVPGIPPWLEDLVLQLLAKDPDQRPPVEQVIATLAAQQPRLADSARQERQALAAVKAERPSSSMLSSVGHAAEERLPQSPATGATGALFTASLLLAGLAGAGMVTLLFAVWWLAR